MYSSHFKGFTFDSSKKYFHFYLLLSILFRFVVVFSNGNERGQKQKQKSFFHILTIDLKKFFIRNGNETGQIKNFVDSQAQR